MSPVKSSFGDLPFQLSVTSTIDEPRMCAARTKRNASAGELLGVVEVHRLEQRQALLRLFHGVERQRGVCLLARVLLAYAASSSCRCPESGSRMLHRSMVAGVA